MNYYLSIFSQADNSALIWNRLKHLGLIKVKETNRCLTCTVNELNKFFVGGTVQQLQEENCISSQSYEIFDDRKLYFTYTTPKIISKAFARIKSSAVGSDKISIKLIKIILPYLMPVVEHMFNFSLMHGIVPKAWKTALVTPIPKIKHPTLVQHYGQFQSYQQLQRPWKELYRTRSLNTWNRIIYSMSANLHIGRTHPLNHKNVG